MIDTATTSPAESAPPPSAPESTAAAIPYIPDNAPFNKAQRQWLNGYLAGFLSDANSAGGTAGFSAGTTGPAPVQLKVALLFGSQTGTAEALAKKTRKQLKAGFPGLSFSSLDECSPEELATCDVALILTSTYGDGDPPDNAAVFYESLLAEDAPKLDSLRFSVFGLGDRSYPEFNACAERLDARLEQLGAERCAPAVYADVDYEGDFQTWLASCQQALDEAAAASSKSNGPPSSAAPDAATEEDTEEEDNGPAYDRNQPYLAHVSVNRNLNGPGSAKETRHIEIDLGDSGIRYAAGDALAVKPSNQGRKVDALIRAAGFKPEEPAPLPSRGEGPLFDALRIHYDITALTPAFVMACARLSKAPELQGIVDDEAALTDYIDGREMIDPILEFGVIFPTTEYLIAPLRQLQPRLYSISSGPGAHPGAVHVTVGVVRYDTHGKAREGVCSNYLARLGAGASVPVYIHHNKAFRLPKNPDSSLIMVGPGTGIAPFRAYLEERRARGDRGRNWLFFGDQHAACDYLYRDELNDLQADGTLSRLDTAFSRDSSERVYVQHRMLEQAEELYAWLENGACFCVCGDASRMAKDVDATLHQIIAEQSGRDEAETKAYVTQLKKEKRYLRDVY